MVEASCVRMSCSCVNSDMVEPFAGFTMGRRHQHQHKAWQPALNLGCLSLVQPGNTVAFDSTACGKEASSEACFSLNFSKFEKQQLQLTPMIDPLTPMPVCQQLSHNIDLELLGAAGTPACKVVSSPPSAACACA